jgi:hypothetical protein
MRRISTSHGETMTCIRLNGGRNEEIRATRSGRFRVCAMLCGIILLPVAAAAVSSRPMLILRTVRRVELLADGISSIGQQGVQLQKRFYDCGPAALAHILSLVGRDSVSIDSISRLAGSTWTGTHILRLALAARALGVEARVMFISASTIAWVTSPLVVLVDNRHFVAVTRLDSSRTRFNVVDPLVGRYQVDRQWLHRHLSGVAIVFGEATGEASWPDPVKGASTFGVIVPTSLSTSGGKYEQPLFHNGHTTLCPALLRRSADLCRHTCVPSGCRVGCGVIRRCRAGSSNRLCCLCSHHHRDRERRDLSDHRSPLAARWSNRGSRVPCGVLRRTRLTTSHTRSSACSV